MLGHMFPFSYDTFTFFVWSFWYKSFHIVGCQFLIYVIFLIPWALSFVSSISLIGFLVWDKYLRSHRCVPKSTLDWKAHHLCQQKTNWKRQEITKCIYFGTIYSFDSYFNSSTVKDNSKKSQILDKCAVH